MHAQLYMKAYDEVFILFMQLYLLSWYLYVYFHNIHVFRVYLIKYKWNTECNTFILKQTLPHWTTKVFKSFKKFI